MTDFKLDLSTTTKKTRTLLDYDDISTACFPVALHPLYYKAGGNEYPADSTACVVRSDTNKIVSTVSTSYSLVKNEDIAIALDEIYKEGWKFRNCRNVNNKVFSFDLISENIATQVNGFTADMRISIVNSYDRSTKFSLDFGAYIQVCSNGMKRAVKGINTEFKHQVGVTPSDIADFILETIVLGVPLVRRSIESAKFNSEDYNEQFKKLAELFPKPVGRNSDITHPVVERLATESRIEFEKYQNGSFAVFMAATNMATRPDKFGIPASYIMQFESLIDNVFLGEPAYAE